MALASMSPSSRAEPGSRESVLGSARFYHLFDQAESVRWKISDLPWERLDHSLVSDELLDVVTEIAMSELTTWSASRMFLEKFHDDVDFTQWVSVWMYEETKHPYVLMRWLELAGRSFDADFVASGRATEPFIRSRVGTLVMNILSEIEASSIYMRLSKAVREPVLKTITRLLSSDEARHSGSFYVYASKMIACSNRPRTERIEALKVLYFWLTSLRDVQHPVAIVSRLVSGLSRESGELPGVDDRGQIDARMRSVIGTLVGISLDSADDVMEQIRRLALG